MTKPTQKFKEKIREMLMSLVNECEMCAIRGERIMCQTAPTEEMRLKCVDKALTAIIQEFKEIVPKKKKKISYDKRYKLKYGFTMGFNQAIDQMNERIGE